VVPGTWGCFDHTVAGVGVVPGALLRRTHTYGGGGRNCVAPCCLDERMPNDVFEQPITITCDSCIMQYSHHCGDCVVTFICDRPQAVVLDLAEQRAVRLLAAAGLVPTLRHREAI
jgi:hypothetical protein